MPVALSSAAHMNRYLHSMDGITKCITCKLARVRKHRGNGSLDIKEHPLLLAFAQSSGCSIFLSSCQVAYGLPRLGWL